jgi:AcrR family transcriptional regulator
VKTSPRRVTEHTDVPVALPRRARGRPMAAERPSRPLERAARQRQRILDAAERCFIERGFHAASMAGIANTARMSIGLIYHYFDSKAAIVKAIVARQLEKNAQAWTGSAISCEALVSDLLELFKLWQQSGHQKMNAPLLLQLVAESARDLEIAGIMHITNRAIEIVVAQTVLSSARANGTVLTATAARGRAMVLRCLVEGLALRASRDPQITRATFKSALELVIRVLFI